MHPIASILLAICGMGIWAWSATYFLIVPWADEVSYPASWDAIQYTTSAFSFIAVGFYIAYLVSAGIATHYWRKERQVRKQLQHQADRKAWELGELAGSCAQNTHDA
jgi:hypothetical protein